MFDLLFANLGTMAKAIGCLQHIESLFVNVLVGLEGDAKNVVIDEIVKILQNNKVPAASAAPAPSLETPPQGQ